MELWHGDENECRGHCGVCDECNDEYYHRSDEAYESWQDEQLFN